MPADIAVDEGFEQAGARFDRVEGDVRELRGDIKRLDEKLTGKIEAVDEKLTGKIDEQGKELRGSITALQYQLVVVCLVIIGAIVGSAIVF